eukprot:576039-Pleurochrysis_carterae.AAC.1
MGTQRRLRMCPREPVALHASYRCTSKHEGRGGLLRPSSTRNGTEKQLTRGRRVSAQAPATLLA